MLVVEFELTSNTVGSRGRYSASQPGDRATQISTGFGRVIFEAESILGRSQMKTDSRFRLETRAWLEENCPESMRQPLLGMSDQYYGGTKKSPGSDDQRLWAQRMAEKGWTAPEWPPEFGGAGLTREQAKILREEMRRINARDPITSPGMGAVAPVLFKYGTKEQQQEHLPPMAKGQTLWCQGFSEPGSGSDLASLQTRAEDRGDHYLVNGSKIWTSFAADADWCYCLTRTDNSGSKHDGITFLLIDMTSPGISVEPIVLISGSSPFCQTFFDDVLVPKRNRVAEAGAGWPVAKYLLSHERAGLAAFGGGGSRRTPLGKKAIDAVGVDSEGKLADPILRKEIAQLQIDLLGFGLTTKRVGAEVKAKQARHDRSAFLKYYGTELNKRRHEAIMSIQGASALVWDGEAYGGGHICRSWLRSKANSIEGGTSEVQLNVIAKRILDLPEMS